MFKQINSSRVFVCADLRRGGEAQADLQSHDLSVHAEPAGGAAASAGKHREDQQLHPGGGNRGTHHITAEALITRSTAV